MGWRDELREMGEAVGQAALSAARNSADRLGSWAEEQNNERKVRDFDAKMNEQAEFAKAMGKDGTHTFNMKDHGPDRDPKSITFDPFDLVSLMGWRERPSQLSFTAMEATATGVPVVADVIRTRMTQVQTFCQRPEDRYSPGFKVRPRDPLRKMDKKTKERCEELEHVLLHTGYVNSADTKDFVSLREFCGMFIRDSLTYDQACFEVVPDKKGRPSYMAIVDPTTIRLLDPAVQAKDKPFAVQVVHGSIVADFVSEELAFCIRNPRSGIRSYGYGLSELETLVREITGFLWGIEYNRRFFSQGSSTKGILNFKGTIPDKHLQAFRRQWYAMVSGVHNSWRTPITNADDLQWISMQMSNKDMEMGAWMDFLIKIVCARYQIAPEEVNFSYGNSGQSQAMGQAPIEEKLKASRDLGLRPLVQWFFECINKHFLQIIDPAFEAVPIGLDQKGADAETDLLQKQTKIYMTVDEARHFVGMDPLGEGKGDLILDPTWLQYMQSQEAMAAGDEGDEGEGFDQEEGDYESPDAGFDDMEELAVVDPSASSDYEDEGDNTDESVAKSLQTGLVLDPDSPSKPKVVRYEVDL